MDRSCPVTRGPVVNGHDEMPRPWGEGSWGGGEGTCAGRPGRFWCVCAVRLNEYAGGHFGGYVRVRLPFEEGIPHSWTGAVPPLGWGLMRAGSQKCRGGGPARLPLAAGENHFYWVRVGHLSRH